MLRNGIFKNIIDMVNEDILIEMAEDRARELFTKEYMETATDSWYMDELLEFEDNGLSDKCARIYMDRLSVLKDRYYDEYFPGKRRNCAYHWCAALIDSVIEEVVKCSAKISGFEVEEDMMAELYDLKIRFEEKVK